MFNQTAVIQKFTFIAMLLLLNLKVWATDFVVTSNADSGPGTLREALTLAKADTVQTDNIFFNLPNLTPAGRTIQLLTELPEVSSNLTIDASTQPGAKFGVSDARVQLLYQPLIIGSLDGLKAINRINVAIYGLYINLLPDVHLLWMYKIRGIYLQNCRNVQIGAAGKGNIVNNFRDDLGVNHHDGIHGGTNEYTFANLTLKANFFGIGPDGVTTSTNSTSYVYLCYIVGQLNIGGLTESEGNLFPFGLMTTQSNYKDAAGPNRPDIDAPAVITVKNNKIGINYPATAAVPSCIGLNIGGGQSDSKNTVYIEDNIIASASSHGIHVFSVGGKTTILRNYIGTDKTRQKSFPVIDYGMRFSVGGDVIVGSNDPADANYMTNCREINITYGANVTINKNSFYCLKSNSPMHGSPAPSQPDIYPKVAITGTGGSSVSGTSTPNAVIELFYSDNCNSCAPQTYFASTIADAGGNWSYSGPISGTVIASATLGKNTSDFSTTTIEIANIKVVDACNGAGGAIRGAVAVGASTIKWFDENNNVVGNNANLENVAPGRYKLTIDNGSCSAQTQFYEVFDVLKINSGALTKKDASCNNADGYIKGLTVSNRSNGTLSYSWKDANGSERGQGLDLVNVPAGAYTLTVTTSTGSCKPLFGPFILGNTNGPAINQSNAVITSTNCGQSAGSITGISATGTGTLKYSWKNELQQEVGITADLTGMAGGRYILQVTDASSCGPAYTAAITIPETNGIVLDDTNKLMTPASCGNNNASITGIVVSGATQFKWVNTVNTGITLSSVVDLTNAPPGNYLFTATNGFGCTQTRNYTIGAALPTVYPSFPGVIAPTCYGRANGSLNVTVNNLVKSQRWLNSTGTLMGTGTSIANLGPDTYRLFVTDASGCEVHYGNYIILELAPLQITANTALVNNDACNTKTGSIQHIQITGGTGSYNYTWTNSNNATISNTADAINLNAGTYTLTVTDSRNCSQVSVQYVITNTDNALPAPAANNVTACNPGNITLSVINPSAQYGYRLYDTFSGVTPVAQQAGGSFTVTIAATRDYYISAFAGTCESPRTLVQVSVGMSAVVIANTFTPNGDGINDFWKIAGIEHNPAAEVQIFTRSGQSVFRSVGYQKPFDGTFNGKALPTGTYYYTINMGGTCKILSGSLTIIR